MTYDLEFLAVKDSYSRHHMEDVIVHMHDNNTIYENKVLCLVIIGRSVYLIPYFLM